MRTNGTKKIDENTIGDIVKLEVHGNQAAFVATNTQNILEAYCTITPGGSSLPFDIYHEDIPIGFLMIGYGTLDE